MDRKSLPKGDHGRSLCRWCNLEVPEGRWTFCSDWCVEEWKLRSNPSHLRERVLQRDCGVCADCGLNCIAEFGRLKRLRGVGRVKANLEWNLKSRKSLWDADHIVPVAEGGGECDLANMRTLCLKCHKQRTLQLRERMKMAKPASG